MIYIYTNRPGDAYEYIQKSFDYFRKNFDNNGLGSSYHAFMAYDIATKSLESADKNREKMIQNYMVKKQKSLIAEALSVYVKLLKQYHYRDSIVQIKLEEISKIAQKLDIYNKYKEYLEIRKN